MADALVIIPLVLALPPTIEQIVKLGQELSRRIELCRGFPDSIGKLAMFRDESSKLKLRFNLGHKICNTSDPNIDADIKRSLDQKFQEIQQIIKDADQKVKELEKPKVSNFWRINELRRDMEGRIQSLEAAVTSFNDTITLVHIEQTSFPNAKLESEIFQFDSNARVKLSETSFITRCHLARDINKVKARRGEFLLETLIDAEMSSSLMRAAGYVDDPGNKRFLLVFDIPANLIDAGTLQTCLQTVPPPALNVRIALCSKLANAILGVHNLRLVHKNVNSASVLIMKPPNSAPSLVSDENLQPVLLNWHLVRKVDAATLPSPERKWWRAIYQHPNRQITLTEDEYTMGHDIYSLGVCMLEALLWKPLVQFADGAQPTANPVFVEHVVTLKLIDGSAGSLQSFLDDPKETTDIQKVLLSMAKELLPPMVGQKLTLLVISCLTCLENGFEGLSFQVGTDRIRVGMNYVMAVKTSLAKISI
ncbi:MAG: hypothetical protein MMC33_009232 [Icmadophila ericetorum]|nr:hypothetical protein [Icmadophila ericetorum]